MYINQKELYISYFDKALFIEIINGYTLELQDYGLVGGVGAFICYVVICTT